MFAAQNAAWRAVLFTRHVPPAKPIISRYFAEGIAGAGFTETPQELRTVNACTHYPKFCVNTFMVVDLFKIPIPS